MNRVKLTNIKDIDKRKQAIAKASEAMFITIYKYIANDNKKIIKKYNNLITKDTFIQEHKQDVKAIIKSIYRKTFDEFGYDTRKVLNELTKDAVFIMKKSQKANIDNTWNEYSLKLINNKAEEHADYILDTLYDDTEFYHKKANKTINEMTARANNDILTLASKITALNVFVANQKTADKIKQLKAQQAKAQAQVEYLRNSRNEAIADEFYNEFNKNVVKQSARLQSKQEVGFAESASRQLELAIISDMQDDIDFGKKKVNLKNAFIKEWDATLDGKTRKSHAEANGQQVKVNEKFAVKNPQNGSIEYGYAPRDENFSLANKINCRCVMVIYMNL